MSDFKHLCSSSYAPVKTNLTLKKLIVFARNGDRCPEQLQKGIWSKRRCINCTESNCYLAKCNKGMLTIKGFKQGHDLAAYIKKEYYPKFSYKKTNSIGNRNHPVLEVLDHRSSASVSTQNADLEEDKHQSKVGEQLSGEYFYMTDKREDNELRPDIKVQGYYYNNEKNLSFLKSVTESLEYSKCNIKKIEFIGCKKVCLGLRNSLFDKKDSEKIIAGNQFHSIISSLCNDVPINCSSFDCDLTKMQDFLVLTKMNFEDDLARMREEFSAKAVDFASLSSFLLRLISQENDIEVASVSGETIISLLAGLNTNNNDLVAYGGSVFIEVWADKMNREFVSLRFNGKELDFGFYKEKFIHVDQFKKYLKLFSENEKEITKICRFRSFYLKKTELIEEKKKRLNKMLGPLIEKLHKNRLLNK